MPPIPRTIDIRDDLERARETSERDVDDDVDDLLARLERFAEPDRTDPEGRLADVEDTLLRLAEQEPNETAATRFEAARNRVEQFRTALSNSNTGLVVVRSELRSREDDESGAEYLYGERAKLSATVANVGDTVAAQVEVTFLDADQDVLDVVTTRVDLDAGGEETVELDVEIPDGAVDYAVVARPATPE